MSFLVKAVTSLISPALQLAGVFDHKKKPAVVQPGPATRDDAKAAADSQDELRRRKGAAADMLTGTQGAEAAASSVGRLVASN